MATLLGSRTKPTWGQEWWGLNSNNQHAYPLTLPAGGPWNITNAGAWFAGKDAAVTSYIAVWNTSGTLLGNSSSFSAAGLAFANGNSQLHEYPVSGNGLQGVAGGTTVWVGFSRAASGAAQFGVNSGGATHRDDTSATSPGNMVGYSSHAAGSMGVFLYYVASNAAPYAPTPISPATSYRTADDSPDLVFQHRDPDADNANAYNVQIDNDGGMGSPIVDATVGGSWAHSANITYTGPGSGVLSRGSYYHWRARTRDTSNVWGPWCGTRSFHIDQAPYAPSPSTPVSGAIVVGTAPSIYFSHSDPDGDALYTYNLQVDATSGFGVVPDWISPWVNSVNSTNGIVDGWYVGLLNITGATRGQWYAWRAQTTDYLGMTSPWSTVWYFKINTLPTVGARSPATAGLAPIWNLSTDLQVWTSGGAFAKPTLTATYNDAGEVGSSSAYRLRLYNDNAGVKGTLLYDSTKLTLSVPHASAVNLNATQALVPGTQYWWSIEFWDYHDESSGEANATSFKVRFGQAIYEYAIGSATSKWSLSRGAVGGSNVQVGFLFATATGAAGAGRSAWVTDISSLTPAAYVNIMVRLSTATVGQNPTLPDMTLNYLGTAIQPDKWATQAATPGDWSLDGSVKRFGSQSLKCAVSTNSSERYIYPWLLTSGDDIPIKPYTAYVMSCFVKTLGTLQNGAYVVLQLYEAGSLSVQLNNLYTDTSASSVTNSGTANEGWQRLRLLFTTGSQTRIRPLIQYYNGGVAGDVFWVDAVKIEEGNVATAWAPGFIGDPVVLDSGGVAIDGSAGGIFRLRGSGGTIRDSIELAANGLLFGADTLLTSTAPNVLAIGSGDRLDNQAVGIIMRKTSAQSITNLLWTKIASYTNTDRAGFGMTWNAYGGHEIRCDVAGLYLVHLAATFTGNTGGNYRALGIMRAGGATPTLDPAQVDSDSRPPGTYDMLMQMSRILDLAVNDTLAVSVFQNSGVSLNCTDIILSATRIGT